MDRVSIEGYEGFYEITRDGRVFSLDRITTGKHGKQRVTGREIMPITHKVHGYQLVNLAKDGKVKQRRLHILVAKAFIPNPENKPTVNHEDGIKTHNWVENLTWATEQEQMDHAKANGLTALGDRNGSVKILEVALPGLRDRILGGELIQDVATEIGVNRNTLAKALTRAFGSEWDGNLSEKRTRASDVRWGNR